MEIHQPLKMIVGKPKGRMVRELEKISRRDNFRDHDGQDGPLVATALDAEEEQRVVLDHIEAAWTRTSWGPGEVTRTTKLDLIQISERCRHVVARDERRLLKSDEAQRKVRVVNAGAQKEYYVRNKQGKLVPIWAEPGYTTKEVQNLYRTGALVVSKGREWF